MSEMSGRRSKWAGDVRPRWARTAFGDLMRNFRRLKSTQVEFGLTDREMQTLVLMRAGYCNKEIAVVLGISSRTVEIHRGRALESFQAKNTILAVLKLERILAAQTNTADAAAPMPIAAE